MPVLTMRFVSVIRAPAEVGYLCIGLDQRPSFTGIFRMNFKVGFKARWGYTEFSWRLPAAKPEHHPRRLLF